uniref:Uncharacterized protein n=1 Tax=Ficus carica TaxID=3494 RepID=A0AA88EDZ7_FICCA|nr:hypothetical protein TIFTF001_055935 [Ficus carica]
MTFPMRNICSAIDVISPDVGLKMNCFSRGQYLTFREYNVGNSMESPLQNFSSFGRFCSQRFCSLGKDIFSNLCSPCSSVISTSSIISHPSI